MFLSQTFFVEGIGSPSLDYMLSLSALKLAESKGLHRQPAAAWNLGDTAVQIRRYMWWAIYGFERLNAYRSGRPLVCARSPSLPGDGESCILKCQ